MSNFLQPDHLETADFKLIPLVKSDWENLYLSASDPKIWEQHPNKDRWKRQVFRTFFDGALQSNGAFVIFDKKKNKIIGSTRFYDFDEKDESIFIGYTFYQREYWGTGINGLVKNMMLDYIFNFVKKVKFHVGTENFRSQKAMEKLGAKKVRKISVSYFGEPNRDNFEYEISKDSWAL